MDEGMNAKKRDGLSQNMRPFQRYFDAWSNEHLRHLMEQGLKIFDGNQNRSALGFMKYITRTNFNSTMKGFISVKKLT